MKKRTKYFAHLTDVYQDTRKNKRFGRDSLVYEFSWMSNLYRDFDAREKKELAIDHNYTFLVSIPRWREIMATEFKGRVLDHEICEVVIPTANKVLSPYTFNNRKGMGASAAINQLIFNIEAVTENYTRPARIIKLDIKGYFPNARWDYAYEQVCKVIDLSDYPYKGYMKWLAQRAIYCDPANHCEFRTPRFFWDMYIDPEKSIFSKPYGVGAAIGRLIWQTAMGLYINDDIRWLNEVCGIPVVCFVDDIVMVVPEHLHEYALSLIPELRRRFSEKGVHLNDGKFYDQPATHGVEFLGSHIMPRRIHLNTGTIENAIARIDQLNALRNKKKYLEMAQPSINSYTGLTKTRTNYKATQRIRERIVSDWWKYLEWDEARQCVIVRPGYKMKDRLNEKYHLNLTYHDERRKNGAA